MSRQNFRKLRDPETLRQLVERLRDGIYITNEKGEFLDANQAVVEILGLSSLDDVCRSQVQDFLVDPSQREQELELLRRDGAVREFEIRVRRPNGEVRTLLDTAHSVRDPGTGEVLLHGMLVDITERKRMEHRLRELSVRDPLTGCYNRRYLSQFQNQRQGLDDWGAIFIDIDNFKDYNDRFGHAAGDEVLVKVSRFLIQTVRVEDPVIRMGGDEFLVMVLGEHASFTGTIAKRLQETASESAPFSFSLGWAVREATESLDETIARADNNLIIVRVKQRDYEKKRRNG